MMLSSITHYDVQNRKVLTELQMARSQAKLCSYVKHLCTCACLQQCHSMTGTKEMYSEYAVQDPLIRAGQQQVPSTRVDFQKKKKKLA